MRAGEKHRICCKNMDLEEEKTYAGEELSEAGIHICAPLHTALLFSYRRMG
jgi:hypothetical protein